MKKSKKGFTLIEMLVVIAVVALLVAIVIPTVSSATTRANAGADAANLRSVLGEANVVIYTENNTPKQTVDYVKLEGVRSKSFKNAKLFLVYTIPGFIDVFFVDGEYTYDEANGTISGGNYYGLDYFTSIAGSTNETISTEKPEYPDEYKEVWHCLSDN